jgi:hypothetical protein
MTTNALLASTPNCSTPGKVGPFNILAHSGEPARCRGKRLSCRALHCPRRTDERSPRELRRSYFSHFCCGWLIHRRHVNERHVTGSDPNRSNGKNVGDLVLLGCSRTRLQANVDPRCATAIVLEGASFFQLGRPVLQSRTFADQSPS